MFVTPSVLPTTPGEPRVGFGLKRLDDILKGGLPRTGATLIYGAPYAGKRVLARSFLLAGVRQGVPAIMVVTDQTATEAREALSAMDPSYAKFEGAGLVAFVDTYSRSVGAEDDNPYTEYVDGPTHLDALAIAVTNARRRLVRDRGDHRMVVNSLSTILRYNGCDATFRFLQTFIGKARRGGATNVFVLQSGLHAEPDVQMCKHLMDGVLHLDQGSDKHLIRIEGNGVTESRAAVEYRYTPTLFEVTGSIASGRII
ncbi:MAG: RAD55 family ATPase [Actinomycetota bacterium]